MRAASFDRRLCLVRTVARFREQQERCLHKGECVSHITAMPPLGVQTNPWFVDVRHVFVDVCCVGWHLKSDTFRSSKFVDEQRRTFSTNQKFVDVRPTKIDEPYPPRPRTNIDALLVRRRGGGPYGALLVATPLFFNPFFFFVLFLSTKTSK